MTRLVLLFTTLGAADALAVDLELAAEVATQPRVDDGWQRFGQDGASVAPGLRVGIGVHDNVDITASWHHTRFGADVFGGQTRLGVAAYAGNDASVGIRGRLPVGDAFRFTGEASLVAHLGWARFDDAPDDRESPVQVSATGLAPGFRVAGGAAVHVAESALPVTVVLFADAGVTWTTQMSFGPYGDVASRGLSTRAGAGVRF